MDPLPAGFADDHDPFDEKEEILDDIDRLSRLGYLEDDFDFCGFHFSMRTLYPIEEAACALAIKEFSGTLREPETWAAAQVGLALTSIEYDEAFCPPVAKNIDPKEFARQRFNYITQRLMQPIIDYLFSRYINLLERRELAVKEAQDLSQGSLQSFWPGVDSSKEQGTSEGKTDTDIQP